LTKNTEWNQPLSGMGQLCCGNVPPQSRL
jgi:hypothetical protein